MPPEATAPAEVDITDFGFMVIALDLVLLETPVVEQSEAALQFFAVQNDLLAFFFHTIVHSKNCSSVVLTAAFQESGPEAVKAE